MSTNNRVRFLHFHNQKLHDKVGSLTVAFTPSSVVGILDVALALCSSKENFSRKVGRSIGQSRLSGPKAGRYRISAWLDSEDKLCIDDLRCVMIESNNQYVRQCGKILEAMDM